jgi:hypothetical protein
MSSLDHSVLLLADMVHAIFSFVDGARIAANRTARHAYAIDPGSARTAAAATWVIISLSI